MLRAIPLVFFVVLTACMGAVGPSPTQGDDDDDPGPTESARQLYINNVHPVMARCTGTACHAIDATSGVLGKFYTADPAAGYTAIKAASSIVGDYSSIAPILTKIDAGHQGIVYSQPERTDILDWLAAELTEQQQDPTQPPPVDPAQLLREWSACMTQANFDTANMPNLMGNAAAANGQACKNCHTGGAFGFVTDPNSQLYFATLSTSMSQLVKYFGVQNGQVVIATGAMDNAGTALAALPPPQTHPPFITEQLAGYGAITQFYDLTKAAVTAGNCGPPKAVNP